MNLDQTYKLRQDYLQGYRNKINTSNFALISEQTSFDEIGQHINRALSVPTPTNLPSNNINAFHQELYSIVYLSRLADRYVQKSGTFCGNLTPKDNQDRLTKLLELMKQKQKFFHDELQKLIQDTSTQDHKIENLINQEINYLHTFSLSNPSRQLKLIISHVKKEGEFNELKTDAAKLSNQLKKLLNEYKDRCSKEVEMTDMSKTKNNADDDSSSLDSFHTAVEDQDEQIIDIEAQSQPTTKKHNNPTVHAENQEQNSSTKNNLLTKIWNFLKEVWQKIKNIFKNPEKNHELDTVVSFSNAKQRLTDFRCSTNVREIPAVKTGSQTLFSTTTDLRQNQSPEQSTERVVGLINRR